MRIPRRHAGRAEVRSGHRRRAAIAGFALAAVVASALAPGPAHAIVVLGTRVTLDPSEAVWVGQFVDVAVDVLTDEVVGPAPAIDLPAVDGGVILRVGSQGVRTSDTVDGRTVQVFRYSCALFPHRAGTIELPSIRLRFPDADGSPPPVATDPVTLEAGMPPGAESLATIVSAPEVEISESWSPDPRDPPAGGVMVGDAFTRTVVMEAPDVLAMGFPPLPAPEIDGLGVYPKPPAVEDRENRGEFTGRRVETTVFVCQREGRFVIPALEIPWFDTRAREVRRFTAEPVVLEVRPNPALASGPGASSVPGSSAGTEWNPWWIGGLVAFAGALAWLLRRFGPGAEAALERWQHRLAASEQAAFREFVAAARSGSPLATEAALRQWTARLGREAGARALTPRELARSTEGGGDLQSEVDRLESFLFAPPGHRPDEGAGGSWARGPRLVAAGRRARRQWRRTRLRVRPVSFPGFRPVHLAPFNPHEGGES